MVFCVSCGHKLAGRYCGQCRGDSQSTADAQSEVPVLTVPAGGAKNLLTQNASKRKGGFKTILRTKGIPVQPVQELEHSRWYLQHKDGHVVTCQPKAWMDTGGFAMYTDTVLSPWWEKHKTSWSGEGSFPAKRLLVVCDNAFVHKGEELTEKLEQHSIILRRFLPPNMTAWLQPLDLVVYRLIKTLLQARRGLHLARNLKAFGSQLE